MSHFPFLVWLYSTQEMTGSFGNNCSERSKRKPDWEHHIIACAREKKQNPMSLQSIAIRFFWKTLTAVSLKGYPSQH